MYMFELPFEERLEVEWAELSTLIRVFYQVGEEAIERIGFGEEAYSVYGYDHKIIFPFATVFAVRAISGWRFEAVPASRMTGEGFPTIGEALQCAARLRPA